MDIKEVLLEMQKKPVSLFYGAGVSMDCGGPNGHQLFNAVKHQYSGGTSNAFFDYMKEIIDFDNSNRKEIETWIRQQLLPISPESEHQYLFSLPWRAILTTNYDRLPDLMLKTLDGRRLIIPVVDIDPRSSIDPSRPDLLYCFKLLGDIEHSFPNGGWMVLSSNDLNLASNRRSRFFSLFNSLSSSGHIVYLGYSFEDNLVFDLLQEMRFVLRSLPWKGFAIAPTEPRKEILSKMEKSGITWVKGNLTEFIKASKAVFGETPVSAPTIVNQFYVHNLPMRLERATVGNIWRKFAVLDVSVLEPFSKEPKYFFEGVDRSFYPFIAQWDYPRRTRLEWANSENPQSERFSFSSFVKSRANNGNSSDNMIVSLVGSAGSGKTVTANRIAFDWYRSGNPVILVDNENLTLDVPALDGLLDEIWRNYQTEVAKEKEVETKPLPIRFLLVADDCGSLLEQLVQLKNHLKSIGKPADILLITRTTDVPKAKLIDSNVDLLLEVDDTVAKDEWPEFIDHFESLGVISSKELLISNLNDISINYSFFALIYTSVRGVQRPLKDLIREEFLSLDSDSRRVYALVSLLQSQMLTPLKSVMLKSSNIPPDWLDSQMARGRLGGVLKYDKGGHAIIALNRIIADIISETAFRTGDELYTTLRGIINSVTLGNNLEMRMLHLLLIEKLEGVLGRQLKSDQKISLFHEAVNVVRSKPLLLHLARLQIHSDEFEEAKKTLKEALEAHIPVFDEPDQHVIDVKGRLELRLAEKAIRNNDNITAWKHLESARDFFYEAQINPSLTPHPYQGLGRTYVEMARISSDKQARWLYLLLAMQEITYAENYLGGELNPGVASVKKETLSLLESEKLDELKTIQIRDSVGQGNAYAFLAERDMRGQRWKEALLLVEKGLYKDPTSLWLIRLQVALLRRTSPDDTAAIKRALDEYLKIASPRRFDVELTFELAMERFKAEDFATSMKLFHELDQRTNNHPMRLTPSKYNRWLEKGYPKEFYGVIVEAPRFGRYGKVECTSLSGFRGTLPVRPQDVEFPCTGGERVAFNIIFNMVGPQASRVRRVIS